MAPFFVCDGGGKSAVRIVRSSDISTLPNRDHQNLGGIVGIFEIVIVLS